MPFEYKPIPEPASPAQMESLTHDDKVRLIAQRQEATTRAQLVDALFVMGRLEEAIEIAENGPQRDYIRRVIEARDRPDDERCGCEYGIDTADYARNPEAKPKWEYAPNYLRGRRIWSTKHGEMCYIFECHVSHEDDDPCGHMQLCPGFIDESLTTHEKQHGVGYSHSQELKRGGKVRGS